MVVVCLKKYNYTTSATSDARCFWIIFVLILDMVVFSTALFLRTIQITCMPATRCFSDNNFSCIIRYYLLLEIILLVHIQIYIPQMFYFQWINDNFNSIPSEISK